MARDFKGGLEIAVYARTVYVRRVVEPEGVIQFPPALSRNASVHAATSSHFRHIEPSSGWVGRRRGVETAPGPGCLRTLPRCPRRVRRRSSLERLCRSDIRSARYDAGGDGAARHPYFRAKQIRRRRVRPRRSRSPPGGRIRAFRPRPPKGLKSRSCFHRVRA